MRLDARQAQRARRIAQACVVAALALVAGALVLPSPEPGNAARKMTLDAMIASSVALVDQTIADAQNTGDRARVAKEDWSSLLTVMRDIRKPEKSAQPLATTDPNRAGVPVVATTNPTPAGPQPARANPILSTWRYIGPITVGEHRYAVLAIRGKQLLMGIGEESQAFRITSIEPERLVVLHNDSDEYEVALAKPADAGESGELTSEIRNAGLLSPPAQNPNTVRPARNANGDEGADGRPPR